MNREKLEGKTKRDLYLMCRSLNLIQASNREPIPEKDYLISLLMAGSEEIESEVIDVEDEPDEEKDELDSEVEDFEDEELDA